MKKIILLAFTTMLLVGCLKTKENGEPVLSDYYRQHSVENPFIQVLDSCEYIVWNSRMAHKGNCRFCKERRQKELKEFVKQLKEELYDFIYNHHNRIHAYRMDTDACR